MPAAHPSGEPAPLDPDAIRVVSWNIHKESDAGWEADLARFVAGNDILLLQEVTLRDSLRETLAAGGLRWVMASSFIYQSADIGVLTATRTAPVASCTQRVVEPLIRLPKSAVISWLPLAGSPRTLAVANVHSINFSLSLRTYEEQLAALADTLAGHEGPIILGGDLNTWTTARMDALRDVAARLRLTEVGFAVDHLLVRGLDVVASSASAVKSSDHNPAAAVLRVRR
jgi:endonuclease/exonuclease/phosphatase (EEP) superfamily protein YafD